MNRRRSALLTLALAGLTLASWAAGVVALMLVLLPRVLGREAHER